MQYDRIMIRYGELSTKGRNRFDFIRQLASNIRYALRDFPLIEYEVKRDHTYLVLHGTNADEVCERLADVSGFQSYSLVVRCEPELTVIIKVAETLMEHETGETFKVRARRADKTFPYVSDDINRRIASVILQKGGWKVDVHHPDVLLSLDIRSDACYFYTASHPGMGGYPLGVGGKALMMLSGGIDSPVASYLLMKRGILCEFVHFASPPYTSEAVLDKIQDLAHKLQRYQRSIRIHVLPFTKLQELIYAKVDESYAITFMRRMMYRLAERLAHKRNCLAIATGESVGQVASQTLASMKVINQVTAFPVLRPLLTYDKTEIIKMAQKIDTFDVSIRPYEDCCTIFEPKNPKTSPALERVLAMEEALDFEPLIAECLAEAEVIIVNSDQRDEKFL